MLVSKSLYDGEDSMELPTVDINKFSKALDTALKEMSEASINISADFQQGQLSRLITNISSCVYETWGSNYLPDFSTMPHAVSIPTDVDDVITIFKDLKDKSTQLRAYDKRVGKFVRAAFIRSLNKFEQSIMTTDLEEYTSAIAIWNISTLTFEHPRLSHRDTHNLEHTSHQPNRSRTHLKLFTRIVSLYCTSIYT